MVMTENEGLKTARDNEETRDVANNEVGPTEKLREAEQSEADTLIPGVPGAQNPDSEEIKAEKRPNTE